MATPNSKTRDKYCNKAYGAVTESAANTLTFSEIQTSINIFDKVAWVVSRIEWYLSATGMQQFDTSADYLTLALTSSNQITSLALNNPSVIDLQEISKILASSVGYSFHTWPFPRDFSNLPGGGIIIAPRPLYVAAKGTGLAAAVTVQARIFFTQFEMSPDEYLELIDFYRIVQ